MANLADDLPPTPDDKVLMGHFERLAETDLGLREFLAQIDAVFLSCMEGGSGFRMADLLRSFFFEYFARVTKHGPKSLPTSFNVTEAFFTFSKKYLVFALRQEREHLLRLYEYFNWFTAETSALPEDPLILENAISEGMISQIERHNLEIISSHSW